MKLSYYHHYIRSGNANQRLRCDLAPFLSAFATINDAAFKNSFLLNGDNIYLFDLNNSIFLFVVTKSDDIIKAINTQVHNHVDIFNRLQQNENLGYASYLLIREHYYGIASTFYGPKNGKFTQFINLILSRIGRNFTFDCQPFVHESTRADTVRMAVVGQHTIELNRENGLFADLAAVFGCGNTQEIKSFEVIIKPSNKTMPACAQHISDTVQEAGLEKYIVKAKQNLNESLTDYYLAGPGYLKDEILVRDEAAIIATMADKSNRNGLLAQHLHGLQTDPTYDNAINDLLAHFIHPGNWDDFIGGLEEG